MGVPKMENNQNEQTVSSDEQKVQPGQQGVSQGNEDKDWKALYHQEIQYNKKLRNENQGFKASQEEYEKNKAVARQKKMEEEGEYKTLISEKDAKIDALNNKLAQQQKYFDARKDKILDSMSEEDRESFKHLPLSDIEKINKRFNQTTSSQTKSVPEGKDAKAKGEFGGYSSIEEYAMKDPKGADEYLAKNVSGYRWGK